MSSGWRYEPIRLELRVSFGQYNIYVELFLTKNIHDRKFFPKRMNILVFYIMEIESQMLSTSKDLVSKVPSTSRWTCVG